MLNEDSKNYDCEGATEVKKECASINIFKKIRKMCLTKQTGTIFLNK